MTKVNWEMILKTSASSSVGSDSTMWYVYDCENPFAINTNGLTEEQEMTLETAAYDAAGGRYSAYKCHRDEIPAGVEIYEGQKLKDYFNL